MKESPIAEDTGLAYNSEENDNVIVPLLELEQGDRVRKVATFRLILIRQMIHVPISAFDMIQNCPKRS